MLYESHEVIGSDLPIYDKKELFHYTIEDIVNTGQSVEDFKRTGFVKIKKYERDLFQPIYTRKGE